MIRDVVYFPSLNLGEAQERVLPGSEGIPNTAPFALDPIGQMGSVGLSVALRDLHASAAVSIRE